MVKTISQLYLDARRVLITQEDEQMASLMARNLVCHITGKTQEQVLAQTCPPHSLQTEAPVYQG